MKKIKILYIVNNMMKDSGVSTVIMNYYRKINKSKYQIDFLLMKKYEETFEEELKQNGSNIFYLNEPISIKNRKTIQKYTEEILKNNKYDMVELHSTTYTFIFLKAAKKLEVPIRIMHTHSTIHSSNKIKNIISIFLNLNFKKYTNYFFACSEKSGQYWYNKKICNSNNYYIIKNGIEIDKFSYEYNLENELKRKYNLEGYTVVGFLGRLSKDKNIKFLSKIINKVVSQNEKFKFVIIGDGNELEYLKKHTFKYKDNIIFLGMRKDVNKLLNCIDLLLLPSKREGLPMSIVEAQATNVECYISNTVTKEVDMGATKFLKLNLKTWTKKILEFKSKKSKLEIDRSKFDINECAKSLEKIYLDLYNKSKYNIGEKNDI